LGAEARYRALRLWDMDPIPDLSGLLRKIC